MTSEDQRWIHTYEIVGPDGIRRPTFVIDGRTFDGVMAMRQAIDEARETLNALGLDYERETTGTRPDAPASYLPLWQDVRRGYRDRLTPQD